jgi:hypothetical protein
MTAKLIKDHDEYMLINDERFVIATTDINMLNTTDKMKLSKQNCDEIFGVVDVNMITSLLRKEFEVRFNIEAPEPKIQGGYWDRGLDYQCGVISGFNKAIELNKDKVFTLEDMRKAYYVGYEDGKSGATFFQQLIQSLQQPTEIEVIIEMELNMNGKNAIDRSMYIPKLDSEGCLILKRI